MNEKPINKTNKNKTEDTINHHQYKKTQKKGKLSVHFLHSPPTHSPTLKYPHRDSFQDVFRLLRLHKAPLAFPQRDLCSAPLAYSNDNATRLGLGR